MRWLLPALVLVSCAVDESPEALIETPPREDVTDPGPARLSILEQPAGLTAAGTPFAGTLTVAVVDGHGKPIAEPLSVSVTSETAGLTGPSAAFSADGVVRFSGLAATVAGKHRLTVSAEGWDDLDSDPFTVTAGPLAGLRFSVTPAVAIAGEPMSPAPAAQLTDAWGNPVGGFGEVQVQLFDNPANDALEGTYAVETNGGTATFDDLILRRVTTALTLRAVADNLHAAISDPITVVAGAAVAVGFEGPIAEAIAGAPIGPVAVAARDRYGNLATEFDGTLALSTGLTLPGTTLSGAVTAEATGGLAMFDDVWLERARRQYTLKVLGEGLTPGTSAPFDVRPGPPVALSFETAPTTACRGLPLSPPLEVAAVDAFGNPTPAPVTVTLVADAEQALDALPEETVGGIARFAQATPLESVAALTLTAEAEGLDEAVAPPVAVRECAVVEGTVTYDAIPNTLKGLDYDAVQNKPVRGAELEVVSAADGAVLGRGETAESGAYLLGVELGGPDVVVRVFSRTPRPAVRVQDNTSDGALYVLESEPFAPGTGGRVIHAASGWNGKKYKGPRLAAPFSILDTARLAAQTVVTARPLLLDEAVFNWSVNNRPEEGDKAQGQITSTHFSPFENQIYLTGKQNAQTDEFDRHTIVHEWTHWLEANLGRSDSFGGVHWLGAQIEPRLAFGEGVADALPGVVLYPESVYAMTFGKKQGKGWGFDIDANAGDHDPHPGWYSEASVAAIVYDAFDPASDDADEPWDQLALGAGPLIDVLTNDHVTTDAATSIFTFLAGLAQFAPEGALAALAASASIASVDPWGAGETNDAGWPELLPVYRELLSDADALVLPTAGEPPIQFVYSTRFARFEGTGALTTIAADSLVDVDLFVFRRGQLLAQTANNAANAVTLQTEAGAQYVVVLRGVQNGQQVNDCALTATVGAHSAPVDASVAIDGDRAVVTVRPLSSPDALSIEVYGIDGLRVTEQRRTGRERIAIEVGLSRPATASNLVVTVEGRWSGVRQARVWTATVPPIASLR